MSQPHCSTAAQPAARREGAGVGRDSEGEVAAPLPHGRAADTCDTQPSCPRCGVGLRYAPGWVRENHLATCNTL